MSAYSSWAWRLMPALHDDVGRLDHRHVQGALMLGDPVVPVNFMFMTIWQADELQPAPPPPPARLTMLRAAGMMACRPTGRTG
jgi:hypothetical protein